MASTADVDAWKRLGGTIKDLQEEKVWVAADGEEYHDWSEASKLLEAKSMAVSSGTAGSKVKRSTAEALKKSAKKQRTRSKAEEAAELACVPEDSVSGREDAAGGEPSNDLEPPAAGRGNRRAATQGVNYTAKAEIKARAADRVAVKEEARAESEAAALAALSGGGSATSHRLLDFEVHERGGDQQPLERLKHAGCPLLITGTICPAQGKLAKASGKKVACFGPVTSWHICCDGAQPEVCLRTEHGEYACSRAAASYRAKFQHLQEQAAVLHEVVHGLDPKHGGSAELTVEEAAARLTRAKVGKSYASPRAALVVNANFVVEQLLVMGLLSSKAHPFAVSLLDAAAAARGAAQPQDGTESITLRDHPAAAGAAGPATDEELRVQADADYALQMQAKMDAQRARSGAGRRQAGAAYIRISESEIADDYPEPQQYSKVEDETDELLLMDEDAYDVDPDQLPRRVLTSFAVYNAEGFMSSLELLPMWGGVDPDTQLYASGRVLDDAGDWAVGQSLTEAPAAGQEGAGAGASSAAQEPAGMVLFLSDIKEWVAEFGCDMLRISIRTDVAWYCLDRPTQQYKPWFATVLKCARLAVHMLGMLTEEARASRLSFNDIVKRISALDSASPVHISSKVPQVERFLVVHGQVVLNQFKHYPVKAVRDAAFVATLRQRMAQRRHSKLYAAPKVKQRTRVNANPMRDRAAKKTAPMTATATKMVKAIWASYFKPDEADAAAEDGGAGGLAVEAAEGDEVDEDDAAEENALATTSSPKAVAAKRPRKQQAVKFLDAAEEVDSLAMHRKAQVGGVSLEVGALVVMPAEEDAEQPALGLLQAMWKPSSGPAEMQVHVVVRGAQTVLGDAASTQELFLTAQLLTRPLSSVERTLVVEPRCASWSLQQRDRDWARAAAAAAAAQEALAKAQGGEAAAAAEPASFILRSLYLPEQGMFRQMEADLQLGQRLPEPEKVQSGSRVTSSTTLCINGQDLAMGDFVCVEPCTFDQLPAATEVADNMPEYVAKGRFHKGGGNAGLRAMGIARLCSLPNVGAGRQPKQVKKVEVQRYYRPEDISQDQAYKAGLWDVYASDEKESIELSSIIGRCQVAGNGTAIAQAGAHCFICTATFVRDSGNFTAPPAEFVQDAEMQDEQGASAASDKGKGSVKGKGKAASKASTAGVSAPTQPMGAARSVAEVGDGVALKTMDIFAGCGGLSEGMHQARAADTRWAIEYEDPAADAFKLNHPHAAVFAANCNVILAAAMSKGGQQAFCAASDQAQEQAAKMPGETLAQLPSPGEVEFLCGGPPCQGYSGMNRFNKGNWSQVQNSMVMAYLSFADFYRPRYFLLENVRNFVSHNKSFTFRLTLRSLLDMGYQVRFGVLNAGNFGVSQSRKRTFIWGVAPGSHMPDWPTLLHVFRSPQLTINLPGGVQYTAVRQDAGAPLRAVTVRDAIADLPAITNGSSVGEMPYTCGPVSAFQHSIRGGAAVLKDHICKEMNALNLERCRCIPKNVPGADWRVLQELVAEDPSKELFQGQALVPWCLPNTADRHNGWRGLYGRLDWQGHFPTSTTDPQPMGKVGQVFHPGQDRIVSVRECARAQGFPDDFCFSGNVHNRHRQIGNAVPPPLAAALGRQLRRALEDKAAKDAEQLMAAQLAALG